MVWYAAGRWQIGSTNQTQSSKNRNPGTPLLAGCDWQCFSRAIAAFAPMNLELLVMHAEHSDPKSPLEHRRLWLALGWVLVLYVIYLSLTSAPVEIPLAEGDKLGHILAYGTLMIWFSSIFEKWIPRTGFAIGLAAMGMALEFIQGWTGFRTFDIADMAANGCGVIAGWVIAPPRTPNFLRRIERLGVLRKRD